MSESRGCFSFTCRCCIPDKAELTTDQSTKYETVASYEEQGQKKKVVEIQQLNSMPQLQNFQTLNTECDYNPQAEEAENVQDVKQFVKLSTMEQTLQTVSNLIGKLPSQAKQPVLTLQIVESQEFGPQDKFKIYPSGYVNGKRGVKDGVTFFGTQNGDYQQQDHISINTADIVASTEQFGFGHQHFAIFFDAQANQYKVADLYLGSGTFILMNNQIPLKDGLIVSFGTYQITFKILPNDRLQVEFLAGWLKGQKHEFDTSKGTIKIGRQPGNDIKLQEKSLSRTQCMLKYDASGWLLKDGDETKMSTNGTWLFAGEPQVLINNGILKVGKTIFKVVIE